MRTLTEKPLAIVDVETTGTSATYGRVIEVAVLRLEKGRVRRSFQTLVNPGRSIPFAIERLTGIRNDDVAAAPLFEDIARDLLRVLDGAILVAHNARFDYGFLKNEFRRVGISYCARCLCTVKLSRSLYPQQRGHDLSSIISRFGIACEDRHRAMGDVRAVHAFLTVVERQTDPDRLSAVVNGLLKEGSLPPNLDRKSVEKLPDATGVYILYGKEGEVLYVGKSVSIRERVRSHFAADHTSGREMKMCQQAVRVEHRETAGELGALLLESKLIKDLRPVYNVAARRHRAIIVARASLTTDGYAKVHLEEIDYIKPSEAGSILGIFKHGKQARQFLETIAREYHLCHKLLGLQRTNSYCFAYHVKSCRGACAGEEVPDLYNARLETAFAERRIKAWPFAGAVLIEERDEVTGEGEVFLVDQWCLVSSFTYSDRGEQLKISGPHRFDYDAYKILLRYIMNRTNRKKIRLLSRQEMLELLGDDYAPVGLSEVTADGSRR